MRAGKAAPRRVESGYNLIHASHATHTCFTPCVSSRFPLKSIPRGVHHAGEHGADAPAEAAPPAGRPWAHPRSDGLGFGGADFGQIRGRVDFGFELRFGRRCPKWSAEVGTRWEAEHGNMSLGAPRSCWLELALNQF